MIDGFLCDARIGHHLAAVLSALRGPDNGDDALKWSTTNHIRRASFLRLTKKYKEYYGRLSWDLNLTPPRKIGKIELSKLPHFMRHIVNARVALGHDPETGEKTRRRRRRQKSVPRGVTARRGTRDRARD